MEKKYLVVDFVLNRIVASNLSYDEALKLSMQGKSLFDRAYFEDY
jgi:hypothetical protein